MLITKFDLYKSEWLDLVFTDRNKNYGAYELRQHYAGNMIRAMGVTFLGVGAIFVVSSILMRVEPKIVTPFIEKETPVEFKTIKPPVTPPKKVEAALPAVKRADPKPAAKSEPVDTKRFLPITVSPTEDENPPTIKELDNVAIGPIDIKGTGKPGENVAPGVANGNDKGGGTIPGEGTSSEPVGLNGLDVMPEPVGGAKAWQKYLQNNLRYTSMAEDQGIGGKVLLSFVIEKDGKLSSIKVERGVGYGLDEEALRVLKNAAAWKPGMQNGRPVRVRYLIPINFQAPQ
ncbi:energy transducer TonB [Mucilaginibacter gynuensis]|uniref:Energy transducer TonB n=1 Tax=Mucilaginibacter gynuensis TaxID=1302236 RepID=A0ABP8FTT5_9SPHI